MIGHLAVWIPEVDPVCVEGGAQGAAGVAWRGWHEHVVESRLGQDAGIRHTVESDAAAETEIRLPRFAAEPRGDVDEDVFEHALHTGGTIGSASAFG